MEAPQFTLKNTEGTDVSLPEHGIVVLYFYPKADTPGCTLEGQTFTKLYPEFIDAGALILGVSPDPQSAVCDFKQKYGFAHTLLADPDHEVAERYGVWKEKNLYGNKVWGVDRQTFLIKDGEIVERWTHKPGETEERILERIRGLD